LFLGFITGIAVSAFLGFNMKTNKFERVLEDAIDKLFDKDLQIDELHKEISELNNEIEKLKRDSETVQDIRNLIDRLHETEYEYESWDEEEEEEVEPNLPPPPPAIRSSHRCESCGAETPAPGST
jgi:DNA repair exonuclease SbcCD ATPase subunit